MTMFRSWVRSLPIAIFLFWNLKSYLIKSNQNKNNIERLQFVSRLNLEISFRFVHKGASWVPSKVTDANNLRYQKWPLKRGKWQWQFSPNEVSLFQNDRPIFENIGSFLPIIGYFWSIIGHFRSIIGHFRLIMVQIRLSVWKFQINVGQFGLARSYSIVLAHIRK